MAGRVHGEGACMIELSGVEKLLTQCREIAELRKRWQ